MNPEDEHPKPQEREKFSKAGRWKVPGLNPDQPDLPTSPLTRPVAQPPAEATSRFEKPAAPPEAPPATVRQPDSGAFTQMFQAPPRPPSTPAAPPSSSAMPPPPQRPAAL